MKKAVIFLLISGLFFAACKGNKFQKQRYTHYKNKTKVQYVAKKDPQMRYETRKIVAPTENLIMQETAVPVQASAFSGNRATTLPVRKMQAFPRLMQDRPKTLPSEVLQQQQYKQDAQKIQKKFLFDLINSILGLVLFILILVVFLIVVIVLLI